MGKLVRDVIPDIIRSAGRVAQVRSLDTADFRAALVDKLVEEVAELRAAGDADAVVELHRGIEAPIVVIGMFRAGTTFLSQLLDQDPHNRALLRWEAGDSAPPPTYANFRSGPRVDAAHLANDMLEDLNPRMKAIHHEDADGPTECIAIMSQDFKSLSWEAIANVPSYSRWLLATDQR